MPVLIHRRASPARIVMLQTPRPMPWQRYRHPSYTRAAKIEMRHHHGDKRGAGMLNRVPLHSGLIFRFSSTVL
jgi:hypothetical protein